jgi:isoleucyl-tRNA synthetase
MSVSFPKEEERILAEWKRIDAFRTQLELTKDKPRWSFYDGPPFATGLPHYGHLLASTIKDIIPRYWTMKGRYVERRFGRDVPSMTLYKLTQLQVGIHMEFQSNISLTRNLTSKAKKMLPTWESTSTTTNVGLSS